MEKIRLDECNKYGSNITVDKMLLASVKLTEEYLKNVNSGYDASDICSQISDYFD